jgi:D-alanyl-lipoteichoic acid acyltransferase DltB (MBOAT superfamily)
LGLNTNFSSFNIILPIGISFFTFKLISYVVEIHRGAIEPTEDFVTFATYIAFFPTIMSGPIDKPGTFIPQLAVARKVNSDFVSEGLKRVLWGMFLKMCIADKVSPYTDSVFNNYYHHNATTIIVAAILYSFQIYTDFCGYSEMAIGTGQILGIRVTENFNRPLFSSNVGDFWRRWHHVIDVMAQGLYLHSAGR